MTCHQGNLLPHIDAVMKVLIDGCRYIQQHYWLCNAFAAGMCDVYNIFRHVMIWDHCGCFGKHFYLYETTRLNIHIRGVVKKRSFYGQANRKGLPPPLTVRVLWFFQNKLTYFDLFYLVFYNGENWTKIFTFAYGQGRGGWPPHPPYGQPDRKKTVFLRLPLVDYVMSETLYVCSCGA